MTLSPRKLNAYLSYKLPAAYLCGVRVRTIDAGSCLVSVRHRWINQNPFRSMFWAVQGMAAELATGAIVMAKIRNSGKSIAMLVASNQAGFTKKATGRISFSCTEGHKVDLAISQAIQTGAPQSFWMTSVGTDEQGDEVSHFKFEWTIKLRE